ncbi:hypothetical protein APE_0264.1 [Aeropyrum pernix K1]|uniref:DUF4145 domain-containing protein n=1 Tax=Aeropyrum pernix (strain ATCC 700893 / DSM 11879 / JCM 9820 / NBRC 100138 / K1) TaxID=272557 RepID=Q9YFI2_AERPE|nr:DUF4145 domain-containing protein [Aeropyrum pernix]BAA79179.2 hypothetical protein APE_0264.1 [Aeropyrum pernix K1]
MDRDVIGPTECDEYREQRNSKINDEWNLLIEDKNVFANTYIIVSTAVDLYREALSAYQNGAYMAAILMSGVALEALVYDLVAALRGYVKCYEGNIYEAELDSNVYKWVRLDSALQELKNSGIINKPLERRFYRAREMRNLVAHYAQKRQKRLRESIAEIIKAREDRKTYAIIKGLEKGLWATEEEALNTLKETAWILKALIERAYKEFCY